MVPYSELESVWTATASRESFEPLRKDIEADVAVVGGGITGLTAALLLKREGKRVAVLERGDVASGSTATSTAHLTTMYDMGYSAIEQQHGLGAVATIVHSMSEAIKTIERLSNELQISCDFSRVPGYYYAEDNRSVERLLKVHETCGRAGAPVEILDYAPLPYRTKQCFRIDGQAQFHPVRYCNGLARAIHGDGSAVYTGTPVVELHERRHRFLRTPMAKVRAQNVFLATHTPIGVNPLQAALSVERSYAIAVRMPSHTIEGLYWNTATPYEYVRPYRSPDGTEMLIIGGKDHKVGHGHPRGAMRELEKFGRDRFGFEEVLYRWSAQHYDPVDHLPIIGPSPLHPHLFVATGMAGDGLVLGTLAGMLIADAISGRKNPYAGIYGPTRLKTSSLSELVRLNAHNAAEFATDRLTPLAKPESLGKGDASVGRDKLNLRAAYRDDSGKLHEVGAACSHMKCVVHWNDIEKSWDCPCHGSRFATDGSVLEGPALDSLEEG